MDDKSMINRDGTGDVGADLTRVKDKALELWNAIEDSQPGQDVGKVRDRVIELLDDASTWLRKEIEKGRDG